MTRELFAAAAVALCAATAASAMGRRPPKTTETKAMDIQEWKGGNGGPDAPGSEVVTNADGWALAWKRLERDAPPAPDFAKVVVVFAFVGSKPTGGWTAVFDEPVAKGDDLLVRWRTPKPTGMVTQAFTRAWRARAFPRPKGRVIAEAAAE